MIDQEIAARFADDTADHLISVLHDDGLYRHVRFQRHVWQPPLLHPRRSSFYWFDLITVPGALIFQGDGDTWTFRRIDDMFAFFRDQKINPIYWAEKLTCGRNDAEHYDRDVFSRRVVEAFVDAARGDGVPAGTGIALRREVLNSDWLDHEHTAREELEAFEHNGFRFTDTWDWSFHGWDWWFLWSLHAIVWGIAQYDTLKAEPAEAVAS